MDYKTNSSFDSFESQLTVKAQDFLKDAAKWAQIFAVLGFIGVGFLVLAGIAMFAAGSSLESSTTGMGAMPFPVTALSLIYLLMAVVYFFPIYYLYKFASNAKMAFNNSQVGTLEASFQNLKSHFKSIVIIIILTIVFYIIGIMAFAAYMASNMNDM